MLAQGALVQFALVDYNAGAAAAPTFINGWFMPLSVPTIRTKPGLSPSQQMFLSTVPLRATVPFGWFEPLSEPVRFPRALKRGLQQFFVQSMQPVVSFGWFAPLSEPRVKTKRGLLPSNQVAVFFHPKPIVDIAWFQPLSDPRVKTKLGLRASQQQFLAMPPRMLPTPTIVGRLHAVETGDELLFAAVHFARPTTATIGVIELANVPYLGIVEMPLSPGVSGLIEDRVAPASGSPTTAITDAAVSIRII